MLRQVFATIVLLFVCLVASSTSAVVFTQLSADFNLSVLIQGGAGGLAFQYYLLHNTTSVYTVTLRNIWEADNSNLSLAHAGQTWALTNWYNKAAKGPTTNDTQYWTATLNPAGYPFTSLVLNISVPLLTAGSNATDFKAADIEVLLDGYQWSDANTTTQLVFTWDVTYEEGTPVTDEAVPLKTKASKTVDFSNAYFSTLTTSVTVGNETSDVALYLASGYDMDTAAKQSVYVVYDHFDGNLDHTLEVGFGSGPGSSLWWIIIIVVVIIAIVVIILIAVIGFVLVRRRRRSYDSF